MKWYVYVICVVLIILGILCGIKLYKEIKSESYVNGSIDIENIFSQKDFAYSTTSFTLYHDLYDDTNTYVFEQNLLQVEDFNGLENQYLVFFNDKLITNTQITAGAVYSTIEMDFYSISGSLISKVQANLTLKFFSDKTNLLVSVQGQENANLFEQYAKANGFRLKIEKILEA